jgi:hypothetical protein
MNPMPSTSSAGGFRRCILAVLVALNVALVLALVTPVRVLPAAHAQAAGARGAGYLCVTAKPAGQTYDVLYVLDQGGQKLHAFYPANPQNRQLVRADTRDVKKDFGG